MKVDIYQVTDGGARHGQWCRAWQTETMAVPAFWYYDTEAEARGQMPRAKKCPQCERHAEAAELGGKWIQMFQWNQNWYNLEVARAILAQLPREPVLFSLQNAIGCGLPVLRGAVLGDARYVVDEHINHIPAEKFLEPGLIAPAVNEATGEAAWILLDGGHRLTALFRAGAEHAEVYPLTIIESLFCLGMNEAQAEAYVLRHKQAFFCFSPSEFELAGLRLRVSGEREGLKLG